jgi:hypothetical protein
MYNQYNYNKGNSDFSNPNDVQSFCLLSFIYYTKIISLRQKIGVSHLNQNHKFKTKLRTEYNSIYQF